MTDQALIPSSLPQGLMTRKPLADIIAEGESHSLGKTLGPVSITALRIGCIIGAGSTYTYIYATLGEIFAWIIGWDLILEYAISNAAVAVSCLSNRKPACRLAASGPWHA